MTHLSTRLLGVVGVLCLALAGTVLPAAGSDDPAEPKYLNRLFIVSCPYSHTAADDPVGHPGEPGESHSHDFFGNTTTNAYSTESSMLAGGTTCNRAGDTAAYWMPTVLVDGRPVTPVGATFYYRAVGTDAGAVRAFPPGFKMIAGDPHATTAQSTDVVEWACRDEGAKKPWTASVPTCKAGQSLAFRANYPDCWNGQDLDSIDHRSHVAYSDRRGACPASYPVHLPEIAMTAVYPGLHKGTVTLSGGNQFSGHADFWNTWQPGVQQSLVDSCLHAARQCRDFAGPGGAAPLYAAKPSTPALAAGATGVHRLAGAAGDDTTYTEGATVSADGSTVAYEARHGGHSDIVVRPTAGGSPTVVSTARNGAAPDGDSFSPSLSGDGRVVAFSSDATDLVAKDTNGRRDVFVVDRSTGLTTRVSADRQPDEASFEPSVSADGRYVVMTSLARNLVAGDTNRQPDVFRYAIGTGVVDLVSRSSTGAIGNGGSDKAAVSGDGRYVAFSSWSRNLDARDTQAWSDVFLRDTATGTTDLISLTPDGRAADNSSYAPSVSDDGTRVAFESAATDLARGDRGFRDVFVRDRLTGTTHWLSGTPGARTYGVSSSARISGDGSVVVFASANAALAGNTASAQDVYSACADGSGRRLVSTGGDQPSAFPSVDRAGATVAFESTSSTLAPGARAGDLQVYAGDLTPGCREQ